MNEEKARPKEAGGEALQYLSIAQFMKRTTLSRTTIWRGIKSGCIRLVIKVGNRVLGRVPTIQNCPKKGGIGRSLSAFAGVLDLMSQLFA